MGDNLIDSEPAALKPWLNIDSPVYSHCQCRWPNGQKESKYKYKERKQIQMYPETNQSKMVKMQNCWQFCGTSIDSPEMNFKMPVIYVSVWINVYAKRADN